VTRQHLLKIVLPSVLALVLAAAAFAYFTGAGGGSASADANGTRQAITASGGTPSAALYPGGSADVAVTLTNPNSYAVHVNSLQLDTSQGTNGFDVDSGHSGCDVSALSYDTQSTGWDVPAKVGSTNGSLAVDLTGAIDMDADADTACQGASFTVYLKPGA
jgi:hypothetical protein